MSKQSKRLYEFSPFLLDPAERRLLLDGAPVSLSPMAFDTLVVLVERRGCLVEKEELIKTLWPDSFVEEHNLANNISTLRKALGEAKGTARYIETVPKRGYRFVAAVKDLLEEVTEVTREGNTKSSLIIEGQPTVQEQVSGSLAAVLNPLPSARSATHAPSMTQPHSRLRSKQLIGLVALLLAIASAVPLYFSRHRLEPSLPPMRVAPFTSFPGQEFLPSFSPDGNQIAFNWDGDSGFRSSIYVKQIGSEQPLRLTFDTAYQDFGAVWSPDGQRIAFYRCNETECAIFTVPALSGPARKLVTLGPNQRWPMAPTLAWSPDGRFIAHPFRDSPDGPFRIYLVSPDGLTKQALTSPPAESVGDFDPAFSPDGQSVAFFRIDSLNSADVYVVPISGGEPSRLTFDNGFVFGLDWSADGRGIVFSANRAGKASAAGQSGLWRIPAGGGTIERVPLDGNTVWFPRISRRGNRLTYVETSSADASIYRLGLPGTTASKEPPTKLIASTLNDGGPQFSPDGRRITFHSDRSGQFEVWMCDSDGTNPVQVTSSGSDKRSGTPRWSPDGQEIAFDLYDGKRGNIYTIRAEGGIPRLIVAGESDDHLPSWSRDGNWIYFSSDRSGEPQVWKAPVREGDAIQVTRRGGSFAFESFDSKYVYYVKVFPARGIWRVPVEGGEELLILDSFPNTLSGDWALTSEGIYFIAEREKDGGGAVVKFFDFATRVTTQVADLGKVHLVDNCIAVSPDGRHLLYTQQDQRSADITLVENFR